MKYVLGIMQKNKLSLKLYNLIVFVKNFMDNSVIILKNRWQKEKYCKFVSSRGIAQHCDVFPRDIISDSQSLNLDDYKKIKNMDTVYVVSSALTNFYFKIFPNLMRNGIKIILVTGACVISVPNELSKEHSINYIEKIANSNTIIHWFTQNCDLPNHHKITPIPLGIDYHTLQKREYIWGPQSYARQQEKLLKKISKKNNLWREKKNASFSYFQFKLFDRHNEDRHRALDQLKKVDFNVFLKKPLPRAQTWILQAKFKYIISPHGNGLDCHRTWEALYLNCVPIIKSSTIDSIYKDLPVLILDSWEDLTKENLEKFTSIYEKK